MARGIQIPFTLDVRQWRKGIKRVELDIEDLGDEFRDLERDADRAADDIEDSFRDIGRAAQRAGRELDDGLTQSFTESRGFKGTMGLVAAEAFDELRESWGEAVRSGDLSEAFRETLTNLATVGAVLGPAGAAGGAIASVVLTGIYDKLTGNDPDAIRAKEAAASLFDDVDGAEAAGEAAAAAYVRGFSERASVGGRLAEVLGVDSVNEAWAEVGRRVESTGLSVDTVTNAILGQPAAIREVEAANAVVEDQIDTLVREYGKYKLDTGKVPRNIREQYLQLLDANIAQDDLSKSAERQRDANSAARDAWITQYDYMNKTLITAGQLQERFKLSEDAARRQAEYAATLAANYGTAAANAALIRQNILDIPAYRTVEVIQKATAIIE